MSNGTRATIDAHMQPDSGSWDGGQHFPVPPNSAAASAFQGKLALAPNGQVFAFWHVVMVWREFDGQTNRAQVQQSRDGGQTWSTPATLTESALKADYLLPLSDGKRIFPSWNNQSEGCRLIRVD